MNEERIHVFLRTLLSNNSRVDLFCYIVQFDATRMMYIQVEAPTYVVRGEQVGFRVTVFNYWYTDDYLEVRGGG